jgi:hypothetical protein
MVSVNDSTPTLWLARQAVFAAQWLLRELFSSDTSSSAAEETRKTYSQASDFRNARDLPRRNWTPSRFGPSYEDAKSTDFPGPLIGETGFEPATARPPAREIRCRGVLNRRFYWVWHPSGPP